MLEFRLYSQPTYETENIHTNVGIHHAYYIYICTQQHRAYYNTKRINFVCVCLSISPSFKKSTVSP